MEAALFASERGPSASASSSDATQERQQTDVGPSLERTNVVHSIFLSSSGVQKGFVERLYEHLKNAGHDPFFDQESVPRGTPFPESIKQAATETEIGVVILSDDFMLSKWPMLELEILMNSAELVLPLFYKLSPADLKSPKKLSQWKKKWNIWAQNDRRIDVNRWENVVKRLATHTGAVYISSGSEGAYIEKVVKAICKKLRPRIKYDLSYVKGEQRFIEEVEAQFQNTPILGMHGVGGLGKTTFCKVMVNFYMPCYHGKCAIIEFPIGKDVVSIIKQCKQALKQVTWASEGLLEDVHDFDKVVRLMRDRMKRHVFFLAMDNVWEESLDEAKQILKVVYGYEYGTKLLVTSRSEAVLRELLEEYNTECVGPVPSLNEKEALEIFKASYGADLSCASQTFLMRAVNLCLFNGCYHPLALRELGERLKWMGKAHEVERNLSHIKFTLKGSRVEQVIKVNYDELSHTLQCMFLDVAVTFRRTGSIVYTSEYFKLVRGSEQTRYLLSILYEWEHGDSQQLLQHLAFSGIVTFKGEGVERTVEVHDLYVGLAELEAAASTRFLLGDNTNMEAVRWTELERIVLGDSDRCVTLQDCPEKKAVELQDCPNVEVLIVENRVFSNGLRLESMKSLRVLKIMDGNIGNLTGLRAGERLAVFELYRCEWTESLWIAEVESLTQLQTLAIIPYDSETSDEDDRSCNIIPYVSESDEDDINCDSYYRGLLDLRGCRLLKRLELSNCALLDEDCLPALTNLRHLALVGCGRTWKKFPDLGGLTDLEYLRIECCEYVKEIEIWGLPFNLQSMHLLDFPSLKRLPDMRTLAGLTELVISSCESLEEIWAFPSNTQHLELSHCESLEEIGAFPSNTQHLELSHCTRLKRLFHHEHLLSGLKVLRISVSPLDVSWSTYSFPNLQELKLSICPNLRELPIATQLQCLEIEHCKSLEEIHYLPSCLQSLHLRDCSKLKKLPALKPESLHQSSTDLQPWVSFQE